jgi:putative resolvase
MKLSDWARQNGLSYRTAWRLFKNDGLPVSAQQLKTGTILVTEKEPMRRSNSVTVYARVSSRDQKKDLDTQVSRLCVFATSKGLSVSQVVTEIGSGMNAHRAKLLRLLEDAEIHCILVEHRDRLTRFGFEYLEALMRSSGRTLLVLEEKEMDGDKSDLVRDMIEILTSFCARLYGKRSAENRAKKAVRFLEEVHANHSES